MITQTLYKNLTAKEWSGRRVRSLVELRNGWATLPAGTEFTVVNKFKGLEIRSDPCAHCGVQVGITKVHYGRLELLP